MGGLSRRQRRTLDRRQDLPGNKEVAGAHIKIDVVEKPDKFVVIAQMPGYKKSEIKAHMQPNGILVISGAPTHQTEMDAVYLKRERIVAKVSRRVQLPTDADLQGQLSANFNDGELFVTVPKQRPRQPSGETGNPIQIQ